MAIKRISPKEAAELQAKGWVYVDVRSVPEFEAARPKDSVNVPLMHKSGGGMSPNPEFLAVLKKAFPPDAKFVLGCQGGIRSMKAAEALQAEGYAEIVEQRAGFGGARDANGQVAEPGWADAGLPVESGPAPGRDWESMKTK